GIAPALKVARIDLAETLKVGGRGSSLGFLKNRFRGLLIVGELALALIALVGAGLFVRSMQEAQKLSPGFESKNLFVFNFDLGAQQYAQNRGEQFYRDAVERAQNVSGVKRSIWRRLRSHGVSGRRTASSRTWRNVDYGGCRAAGFL